MPSSKDRQNLPQNLRHLCRYRKSASAVARAVGVNRQQFEKYLSGRSFPSMNIRWRIAEYFGLSGEQLTLPPDDFARLYEQLREAAESDTPQTEIAVPQPTAEEIATLRNYVGIYQTYFLNPAWPGHICVGLVFIRQEDRQIKTVFFNRSRDPETNNLHRSRLNGRLLLRGERLFLIEATRDTGDRLSETILFPSPGHNPRYLTGMSFGLTWRPHRMPFASRTIWRRAGVISDIRTVMRQCGIFQPNRAAIDPIVRNFFGQDLNAYSMSAP